MIKRSMFAVAALGISSSLFAVGPMSSFDPYYKFPPIGDIRKGEGAITQEEYTAFVGRSWKEMGGKCIDESVPKYTEYQKRGRVEMMDTHREPPISNEYMRFHLDAWNWSQRESMMNKEYEAWCQNATNSLQPHHKKQY